MRSVVVLLLLFALAVMTLSSPNGKRNMLLEMPTMERGERRRKRRRLGNVWIDGLETNAPSTIITTTNETESPTMSPFVVVAAAAGSGGENVTDGGDGGDGGDGDELGVVGDENFIMPSAPIITEAPSFSPSSAQTPSSNFDAAAPSFAPVEGGPTPKPSFKKFHFPEHSAPPTSLPTPTVTATTPQQQQEEDEEGGEEDGGEEEEEKGGEEWFDNVPESNPTTETFAPTTSPSKILSMTPAPSPNTFEFETVSPTSKPSEKKKHHTGGIVHHHPTASPTHFYFSPPTPTDNNEHITSPTTTNTQRTPETIQEMKQDRNVRLLALFIALTGFAGMLFTAQQIAQNPDGIYAAICRLTLRCVICLFRIICLPCRFICQPQRTHMSIDDSRLHDDFSNDLELS